MAEQAFVIEDYFSDGTNRMQQEEASPMNKKSDAGAASANIQPGDDQRQKSGVAPADQEEKSESNIEQDEEQQKKIMIDQVSPQGPPAAKEAADFLPFRRSVMETDTLLE